MDRTARRRKSPAFRWGLVPGWAKDPKMGNRMINARSETVAEKPAFKGAFQRRRCLIPADGFFEWKRNGKSRTPYHIHLTGHEPFAMAGLWERWRSADGDQLDSCAILTTRPNSLMETLHDRMPVILDSTAIESWLEPSTPEDELKAMTAPYPAEKMAAYPVSTRVNSPRHNDPECLEKQDILQQEELF